MTERHRTGEQTETPSVSIFIRVRDEAAALRQVLDSLAIQSLDCPFEILVLDNASDDGSAEVACLAGSRVLSLPRRLFGYGRALNLGMELSRGEQVVLLSAHAVPVGTSWLQTLVNVLRGDPQLAAASCRQVPSERLSRAERRRYAWFGEHDLLFTQDDLLDACACGADPYELAFLSNSACVVRRSVALQLPFRDLPYAEDRAFALDCLVAGHRVAYVAGAAVVYDRPGTLRSMYHIGRRAQVAKHLIRDLAGSAIGTRFDDRRERVLRMLKLPMAVPYRLLQAGWAIAVEDTLRRRAAVFALRSTGTTVGMTIGTLTWRRHIDRCSVDLQALEEARRELTVLSSGNERSGSTAHSTSPWHW